MKGKSLRGIVILALVVCALLAVASNAFAGAWIYDGEIIVDHKTLATGGAAGRVGANLQAIYCDVTDGSEAWTSAVGVPYLLGGKGWVQRAPGHPGISQIIWYRTYVQRYSTTNGWYGVAQNWRKQTIGPDYHPELQNSYFFGGRYGLLGFGAHYRLRVDVQWYTTNGIRLGWRRIGYQSLDYINWSPDYNMFKDDTASGEGWVYFRR
jgi:hypothetical protein